MKPARCRIYRGRREGTYLYVDQQEDLRRVPEAILDRLKPLTLVMELRLDGKKRLAREDPVQVLCNIQEQGFHLQLPADPKRP